MTYWKRYTAVLVALSVPALAGCGHSQDATGNPGAPAGSSAVPQTAEQQGKVQEQALKARASAAQADQQQGKAAAAAAAQAPPK